ncbi:hypothetical protein V6N11_082627 [Hibiscus sabdariffa]|uniref:Uncharacterized protein n=1 Tax=Hibiscus sabdariffa TaxID=183260 RepID=A0ABR2P9N6_9ROSI
MWITGSMVLLSFSNLDLCGSFLSSTDVWSAWFGRLEAQSPTGRIYEVVQINAHDSVYTVVIQEAELVWVPTVDHRDVEIGSEMGDKSYGASVASPEPQSWATRSTFGDRGGVRSAGDVVDAFVEDQFRECAVVVQTPESIGKRDSLVGLLECGEGNLVMVGLLVGDTCALSSPVAVLGDDRAALASVLGSIPGGVRKIKSVNCLVEALGSPK